MTQGGKQAGKPLCLVDHDAPRVCVEEALLVRLHEGQIGRSFEIEQGPVGETLADEGALAALAGSQDQHGREAREEAPEARLGMSGDDLHCLLI